MHRLRQEDTDGEKERAPVVDEWTSKPQPQSPCPPQSPLALVLFKGFLLQGWLLNGGARDNTTHPPPNLHVTSRWELELALALGVSLDRRLKAKQSAAWPTPSERRGKPRIFLRRPAALGGGGVGGMRGVREQRLGRPEWRRFSSKNKASAIPGWLAG